jgi:hypothetical protein
LSIDSFRLFFGATGAADAVIMGANAEDRGLLRGELRFTGLAKAVAD